MKKVVSSVEFIQPTPNFMVIFNHAV